MVGVSCREFMKKVELITTHGSNYANGKKTTIVAGTIIVDGN